LSGEPFILGHSSYQLLRVSLALQWNTWDQQRDQKQEV
jgi:hypothetical protein